MSSEDKVLDFYDYDGRTLPRLLRVAIHDGYLDAKHRSTPKAMASVEARKPDFVAALFADRPYAPTTFDEIRRTTGLIWNDMPIEAQKWVAEHHGDYQFFQWVVHRDPERQPVVFGAAKGWFDYQLPVRVCDEAFRAERRRRLEEARVAEARPKSFLGTLRKLGFVKPEDEEVVKGVFTHGSPGFGFDEVTMVPKGWQAGLDEAIRWAQADRADAIRRERVFTEIKTMIEGGTTYAEDGGGWDNFLKINERLVRDALAAKPLDDD